MEKIRLGIVGYGNVGRGAEYAISQNKDMELVAIFTRRNVNEIAAVTEGVKIDNFSEIENYRSSIDVMLLCGGSSHDLTEQIPLLSKIFNCVDSFDNHAKIPEYFALVDENAQKFQKISVVSTGWDPGLFSMLRVLGRVCIPNGSDYTFWGRGVSQGHSEAIKRIAGVKYAVQYTIPVEDALVEVRKGNTPILTPRQKHIRDCFVVVEPQADKNEIAQTIKTMPHYFNDYDTQVHFISEEEFCSAHQNMPHGGFVFRSGKTGDANRHLQRMEFSLQLESNPEFTASVMVAYARAAHRLYRKGETGARTVLDVPLGMLLPETMEELRETVI